MRSNLHRKLPLEEIASAVDVSVWWLCHIFKSETGLSPIQYLKTLRMEEQGIYCKQVPSAFGTSHVELATG